MLVMHVIYDKPKDHPEKFVVRRWFVKDRPDENLEGLKTFKTTDDNLEVETRCILANTLEEARGVIPRRLVRLDRTQFDDPVIVEVWM